MLTVAEIRKDTASHYHNALFVGDVHEQIKILRSSGQSRGSVWREILWHHSVTIMC